MKIVKYLFLLIGIGVTCSACDNEYSFNKRLSECKAYKDSNISIDWAPILPIIPMDLFVDEKQIKPLNNGDCLLIYKYKSFKHKSSSLIEYYLPEMYAKDFGKLKLNYNKYPEEEQISKTKEFCKKYLINCGNKPTILDIKEDMDTFYRVDTKRKYKNIPKQDRNKDIAACKKMSDTLIELTKEPEFLEARRYTRHELISQAILDDNLNSSVFGKKEYRNTSNQTKEPEWVAQYRTNYSICKAYAYPDGKGFYLYRPVILDPDDKWVGWLGYRYKDYFAPEQ